MAVKAKDVVMQLKVTGAIPDYKYKHCKVKIDGPIATYMFSNPSARNAYDALMWEGLQNFVHEIRYDPSIRVLVITGDPEGKAFNAGQNVKGMLKTNVEGQPASSRPDYVSEELSQGSGFWRSRVLMEGKEGSVQGQYAHPTWHSRRLAQEYGGFSEGRGFFLFDLDKPVIAMVNGAAYGFGCDIAFYCDVITASKEKAAFSWNYIHRGRVASEGGTYFLPRLCGRHRALEILWLGKALSADQAYDWGLINHVWPDAELEEKTYELARELAECPPQLMGAIKYVTDKGYGDFRHNLRDVLDRLVTPHSGSMVGTHDFGEGMRAFVEKRKPKYTGD